MQGLEAFLENIRTSPEDELLVDRYLILTGEIEDVETRSRWHLKLAEALLEPLPEKALSIAGMIYKRERNNRAAIDIVRKALKALGRPNKAQLVVEEFEKDLELAKKFEPAEVSDNQSTIALVSSPASNHSRDERTQKPSETKKENADFSDINNAISAGNMTSARHLVFIKLKDESNEDRRNELLEILSNIYSHWGLSLDCSAHQKPPQLTLASLISKGS